MNHPSQADGVPSPRSSRRRQLCAALGVAALLPGLPARGQGAAKKPSTGTAPWRFVINEAVTGETNFFLLTARYQPLADFVTQRLKGRQIGIEPVVNIQHFMTVAQGKPAPDLVFGKSVNQLAKLVRDNGYQPLVRRSDPYKAAFIVAKGSSIRTLSGIGRARIIMPDEYAATTAVARAELGRHNMAHAVITHVRFQEAVAQQISNGLGEVGVVNPTVARKWAQEGGRVLAETQPVVNWSVLAGPAMPAETVHQLREILLSMNTQAPAVLGSLGVKEWARAERQDYMALLDYTKE